MVIQEESDNIPLLLKLVNNVVLEESNTPINAYDSRKPQDRSR